MTEMAHSDIAQGRRWTTKVSASGLLSLAAAPTFAIMALLTVLQGGGMPEMLCSAGRDGSPLTGMAAMYLLMSAFHLAPWLRILSGRLVDVV
jgi:hypothetical protein